MTASYNSTAYRLAFTLLNEDAAADKLFTVDIQDAIARECTGHLIEMFCIGLILRKTIYLQISVDYQYYIIYHRKPGAVPCALASCLHRLP